LFFFVPKIPIGVLTHFYTIMPIPKRVKLSNPGNLLSTLYTL